MCARSTQIPPRSELTVGEPMNRTLNFSPGRPLLAARWGIALVAALACLAQSALAQISVPNATPIDFAATPPIAEWATVSIAGAGNTYLDVAALDTGVNTLVAPTSFIDPLQTDTGYNTHGRGYINTTAQTAFTRPTGNAAACILAILQNNSGAAASRVVVTFDLLNGNATTEEITGPRVYYSLTGAAGSWVRATEFDAITPGTGLNIPFNLSGSWGVGATLYFLWADDNGNGNTDGYWAFDNVKFSTGECREAPAVAITTPVNNATYSQSAVINVAASATCPVTNVDFYLDGARYFQDITSPFGFPLDTATAGLALGSHSLFARGYTNASGFVVSSTVNFTLVANTGPSITITSPITGFTTLVGTAITNLVTATDDVAVVKVEWYVDSILVFTRSNADWSFVYNDSLAGAHTIRAVAYDAAGLSGNSSINVTVTNPPAPFVVGLPNGSEWSYYASTSAPPTGPPEWFSAGYNLSSWSNGFGELGGGDAANFYPERTVIDIGPTGNRYSAVYFVTTLNLPEDPYDTKFDDYSLRFRLLCDDGAVVYLNGFEIFRHNMPAGTVQYGTLALGAIYHDGTVYTNFDFPRALLQNLQQFDNVLAVEVHQDAITSSDISFDMMVWGQPYSRPTIDIASPTNGARVLQGNDLVVNVNASPFVEYVEFFYDGVSQGFDTIRDPGQPNFSATIPGSAITNTGPHTIRVVGTDRISNTASTSVVVNVFFAGQNLISSGATWKYLYPGAAPDPTWNQSTFVDTSWLQGPAPLGYGDTWIVTDVRTPLTNIYPTVYYRSTFTVANPSSVSNLTIRLRRDDGGVVYINGREVFRSNMPTGTIGYDTLASAGTASETDFYTTCVSPSVLVAGVNSIALEIHQNALTSSDTTMDLVLVANAPAEPPTVAITAPIEGATVETGATVTIAASAVDPDCSVDRVEFYDGATLISSDTTAPYTAAWTAATVGSHTLTAKAFDSTGLFATTNVTVNVVQGPERIMLVNSNSTWKYLDDSTCPATPDWRTAGFNDSAWPSGLAQLGFGDGDEATLINRTNAVSGVTNIAFYFRKTFNVNGPSSYTNLLLGINADDGAVVYINGTEVWNLRMTNGVTCTSFASGQPPAENSFEYTNINPNVLLAGPNIVAVEVHQVNITSSDVSFDLQLEGLAPPGSQVTLHIALVDVGGTLVPELRWSATGATLIRSSNVTAPRSTWQVVAGATSPYRPTVSPGTTFFYALRVP